MVWSHNRPLGAWTDGERKSREYGHSSVHAALMVGRMVFVWMGVIWIRGLIGLRPHGRKRIHQMRVIMCIVPTHHPNRIVHVKDYR